MPRCPAGHLGVTPFGGHGTVDEGDGGYDRGFQFELELRDGEPAECDRGGVDGIHYCFNLWDTTPCTSTGETGLCPNGRAVFKIPTNILGTGLTARGPNRFCGSMDTTGRELRGESAVFATSAGNGKKDNPRNRIVMLTDTGQSAYLDIIDND